MARPKPETAPVATVDSTVDFEASSTALPPLPAARYNRTMALTRAWFS